MTKFEEEFNSCLHFGFIPNEPQNKIIEHFKDWKPPKQLVEVPQIVADFIKALKIKGIKPLMDSVKFGELGFTEEKLQEIIHWINEHQEEYMRAYLDDYTVEKEQLYEVIINGLYLAKLMNDDDSKSHRFIEKDKLVNWQETGYRLTAKQIKMIDKRYMAFAVKVDEVEP